MKIIPKILLGLCLLSHLQAKVPESFVMSGLAVLYYAGFRDLEFSNIVLFCNHSSLNSEGRHILDLIPENPMVNLEKAFIFTRPEWTSYWRDSLLLQVNDPKIIYKDFDDNSIFISHIKNADYILFDMQSTGLLGDPVIKYLRLAIRVSNVTNIPLMVLDRPIFYDKRNNYGPVHGKYKHLPFVYGLTIGELSKYFAFRGLHKNPELIQVVKLENYESSYDPIV